MDALADIGERAYFALTSALILPMVAGLLWTPFAALTCLAIARARRLEGGGYAKAGALYSLLFFLPWVWLVLRMAGVPVPAIFARAAFTILYALWLCVAATLAAAGAWRLMGLGDEASRPDYAILMLSGMFACAVWVISLRRTLRRNIRREGETENIPPSVPMRAAFIAMSVFWALGALAMFAQGIYEYATFGGRLDSAIPLWIGGVAMALVLAAALRRFGLKHADGWDYPRRPRPDIMPPDFACVAPFLHLYLLIIVPALIALAGWMLGVILWLSMGAR